MKKKNIGYLMLAILTVLSTAGLFFLAPIPQSASYHHFSDSETILQIPNFWNVVSNLPFLIVGVLGLVNLHVFASNKTQYLLFFLGILLVSIGSGYYHLHPDDETLVWDRLPMTIAFMTLFTVVITEFVNAKIGRLLLLPAIVIGIASIFYWYAFNDLRMYVLIQFYPMLAIPIILVFFRTKDNYTDAYWLLLLAYVIAKLLEHFDFQLHNILKIISGHTLKHLAAAIGIFIFLHLNAKRKKALGKE